MFKWWQFRKKKEFRLKKESYINLHEKIRKEHNFIINWGFNNLDMKAILPQTSIEAEEFIERIRIFFIHEYSKFPGSYEFYLKINYINDEYDLFNLHKLEDFYKRIKTTFPEPYTKLLIEKYIYGK